MTIRKSRSLGARFSLRPTAPVVFSPSHFPPSSVVFSHCITHCAFILPLLPAARLIRRDLLLRCAPAACAVPVLSSSPHQRAYARHRSFSAFTHSRLSSLIVRVIRRVFAILRKLLCGRVARNPGLRFLPTSLLLALWQLCVASLFFTEKKRSCQATRETAARLATCPKKSKKYRLKQCFYS